MDWQKTLKQTFIFWFLFGAIVGFLTGCTHTRDISVCMVGEKQAKCANAEKEWKVPLSKIKGYYCVDDIDLRKVMEKLQYCEQL